MKLKETRYLCAVLKCTFNFCFPLSTTSLPFCFLFLRFLYNKILSLQISRSSLEADFQWQDLPANGGDGFGSLGRKVLERVLNLKMMSGNPREARSWIQSKVMAKSVHLQHLSHRKSSTLQQEIINHSLSSSFYICQYRTTI